jgi:hypothetical protein
MLDKKMDERRLMESERTIIYFSILMIVILAVLVNVTKQELFPLASVVIIVIIAISNVIYFYRKRKKQ